jgi:hypothetical protein
MSIATKPPLSFAADIRGLFRDRDVASMRNLGGFDLSLYSDVHARADSILTRLARGDMPCDGAWPVERVETFRQWIADGKQP